MNNITSSSLLYGFLLFPFLLFQLPLTSYAQDEQKPRIYLESRTTSPDILEISVIADSLSFPAFGIAFDLVYDNEAIRYKSYKAGNFFERGGKPIYLISPVKTDQSRLIAGISLKNGDSGVNGGGKLASFYFTILKKGPFIFRFENTGAVILDKIIRNYSNIDWNDITIALPMQSSVMNSRFPPTSIALIILFVILLMTEIWILYKSFRLITIRAK